MVSTQDSESCDPSSNLGRTWIFSQYKILFEELFPFPHLWHSKCDKPLFIFHNCSIQALALTFIKHLTFKPAHTLWTITVGLSWGIVGSVVECSPATRAARVRFPDDANVFLTFLYPSKCNMSLKIICFSFFPFNKKYHIHWYCCYWPCLNITPV